MEKRQWAACTVLLLMAMILCSPKDGLSQIDPKKDGEKKEEKEPGKKDFFFGGPKGFGPPGGQERKILKDHDKNKDGWLNSEERQTAREALKKDAKEGKGGFFKGGFGKKGEEPASPGAKVPPEEAKAHPGVPLYEPSVLRTFFLEFENKDWETELSDFHNTDVEVPATLTVDGKKYKNVGVHFRGMSSYGMVPAGSKRSLNLDLDLVDPDQRLYGAKALNLLNAHEDSSFLSTVLYSHIARNYLPTPKANFVKVVINGESWGVYASVEQFNKDFLAANYKTTKGARWKVRGSPGGGGGLDYVGDKVEDYKRRYEIKSGDDEQDWKTLINLCRVLSQTPIDQLEAALKPLLDVEGVLWFLALDNALINNDGYWVRASDYSLYLDPKGIFHVVPHDMNEAFRPSMGGPGMMGGPFGGPFPKDGQFPKEGSFPKEKERAKEGEKEKERPKEKEGEKERPKEGGKDGPMGFPKDGPRGGFGGRPATFTLDPLIGMEDARKPLRSRLLQVPAWRAKYLEHVRTIANDWLDWKKLGPVVAGYRTVIEKEVEADTKKLSSFKAFQLATADQFDAEAAKQPSGGRPVTSLRQFADQRRKYLVEYAEPKKK
jgi:hypothetical protein